MAKAVKCPVCDEKGAIPAYHQGQPYYTTAGPLMMTCNGCGGKGWVEVSD